MRPKTLLALLVLLVILGGLSLEVHRKSTETWRQESGFNGGKVLGDFPLNDVTAIRIKAPTQEVNLVTKNNTWRVKERDYPADFALVSQLIRSLWELKAVQDVTAGPSQLARLQLVEPDKDPQNGGTLIDLKNAQGKRITALLLGKSYVKDAEGSGGGFPAGRYVMPLDGSTRVALVGESLTEFTPKPTDWLDRSFIQVDRIKSVTISGTTPGTRWTMQRPDEGGQFAFSDTKAGEKADPLKTPPFVTTLDSLTFADVLPPEAKPGASGLDKPITITASTFEDLTYTITAGTPAGDNYPVTVTVTGPPPAQKMPAAEEKAVTNILNKAKQFEGRIFLVSKSQIDGLIKERSAILATSSPTPRPVAGVSPVQAGVSPKP